MATVHIYFGIEALSMTAAQRTTLITGLRSLGEANQGDQPSLRNHWRTRLDNNAVIFEALFNEDHLTIAAFRDRLAAAFGILSSQISHTTQQTAYGLIVTFTYNAVQRMRMAAFGYNGGWSDWETSRQAAYAYLLANIAAWETG